MKLYSSINFVYNVSVSFSISANQANQQPQMSVGKIYCAKLIYENYKFMRRKGQVQSRVSLRHHIRKSDENRNGVQFFLTLLVGLGVSLLFLIPPPTPHRLNVRLFQEPSRTWLHQCASRGSLPVTRDRTYVRDLFKLCAWFRQA